jgi:hypothetical protein
MGLKRTDHGAGVQSKAQLLRFSSCSPFDVFREHDPMIRFPRRSGGVASKFVSPVLSVKEPCRGFCEECARVSARSALMIYLMLHTFGVEILIDHSLSVAVSGDLLCSHSMCKDVVDYGPIRRTF